ncbi:MAG: hypothetical protein MUO76_08650 [Anaerolineaceae bacterium]|nr:hypothetical protein [Anaerolineaceae bacterium]
MPDFLKKFPIRIYGILISILYAIILSGQVLGFLRIYTPITALLSGLITAVLASWAYFTFGGSAFLTAVLPKKKDRKTSHPLEIICYAAGLVLLILLMLWPLMRWPYTPISETLSWDAGIYHFPKAIELYRTGSAWDLSLSYGEYPFGYESLLAFGLSISGDGLLFGSAHALITLFLLLTIWFLARRYTQLPPGVLFFLSSAQLLSGTLPIESNLWWIYKHLVYTIGKNDLFLGAALLAVIFHAPIGPQRNQTSSHPFGLAFTSMIALSIKPNAIFIVAFVWLWALIVWMHSFFSRQSNRKRPWGLMLVLLLLCMLPGILWLLRNYMSMGTFFSAGVMELQKWSIASNLANPFFCRYIPRNLIVLTGLLVIAFLLSLVIRRPSRSLGATFLLLFASFMITPASAFLNDTQIPAQIAWRFAVALLAYCFLVLLNLLGPLLVRIYAWVQAKWWAWFLSATLVLLFTGWLVWDNQALLVTNPKNAIVLKDQFREPVGVDGYHSAYDYVQQNIRDAVVHVDNGLPFYLYDPQFSNSTTHQRQADYYVVFKTAWFDGAQAGYPEQIDTSEWGANWKLIYEDSQGRVYQRVP